MMEQRQVWVIWVSERILLFWLQASTSECIRKNPDELEQRESYQKENVIIQKVNWILAILKGKRRFISELYSAPPILSTFPLIGTSWLIRFSLTYGLHFSRVKLASCFDISEKVWRLLEVFERGFCTHGK